MNKVFFIGNLTKDPELMETPNGVMVCHFSIAVNRNYSSADGERQTDFFNCTAWRTTAETIAKYCKKGNKIAVSGSVQLRNYEDNQGVKRTAVDIIAQDVEFLTPKSASDSNKQEQEQERQTGRKPYLQPAIDTDYIPF